MRGGRAPGTTPALTSWLATVVAAAVLGCVVSSCAAGASSAGSHLNVYVGYADSGLSTEHQRPPTFPNPWQGGQNVNFRGAGNRFDAGAIRVENTGGTDVTVQSLSIDIDQKRYGLWGSGLRVPANGSLILTQTKITGQNPFETNFDTSEVAGKTCSPNTAGGTPIVHLMVDGKTTDARDADKVLDTGGRDLGACSGQPNESHSWAFLTSIPLATQSGAYNADNLLPVGIAAALISFFTFLPALIAGLLLLLAGWLLARWLAGVVAGILDRIGFGPAIERTGLLAFLGRRDRHTAASWIVGVLAGAFVFLAFAQMAGLALHVGALSGLLTTVTLWVPKLVTAIVVVLLGALIARVLGNVVRGASASSGLGQPDLLATVARLAVIFFSVLVAVDEIGVAVSFVQTLLVAILGGIALALGIAFGLGGRDTAAEILERWYARRRRTP